MDRGHLLYLQIKLRDLQEECERKRKITEDLAIKIEKVKKIAEEKKKRGEYEEICYH